MNIPSTLPASPSKQSPEIKSVTSNAHPPLLGQEQEKVQKILDRPNKYSPEEIRSKVAQNQGAQEAKGGKRTLKVEKGEEIAKGAEKLPSSYKLKEALQNGTVNFSNKEKEVLNKLV